METHEILDRYELLYNETIPVLSDIRRVVVDEDLSSIFRIATNISEQKELIDEFRKAVMEKNPHAIFRVFAQFVTVNKLQEFLNTELGIDSHVNQSVTDNDLHSQLVEDLRKSIVEENHRSIFRAFEYAGINIEDLRKAMTEKNHHSIFRIFDYYDSSEQLDELRKAMIEKNHRSIFRVFSQYGLTDELIDLRKAMTEKNLNAVFRIFEEHKDADMDDIRKTIVEDNLHSLFRLLEHYNLDMPLEDIRRAIVEDNLHALFRLIENEETLPVEDIRKAIVEDNLHSLFRLVENLNKDDSAILELIDDVRRSIVEKNWHSIFRTMVYYQEKELLPLSMPIEDLRKSIVEENIHSMFRILARLDAENRQMNALRQAVVNKEIRALMGMFIEDPPALFDTLPRVIRTFPDVDFRDAFSRGQILSKKWLVDELVKLDINLGTVFLCAGWYGSLALLLFESGLKIEKIRSFDKDAECYKIADTINRPYVMSEWEFKAQTEDILHINYLDGHTYNTYRASGEAQELYDKPNTIVNTSCEHLTGFSLWYNLIPKGTLVALQTNNYFEIDDHINCVNDIDEFKKMAPLDNILYEGELNLEKYNRYMLIGYR